MINPLKVSDIGLNTISFNAEVSLVSIFAFIGSELYYSHLHIGD